MARQANNPLEGLSQAEIDAVMAKRPKDMTPDETRIYKKVKYDAWIARGKQKAPRKSNPTPTQYEPIGFIQRAERKAAKKAAKQAAKTPEICGTTEDLVVMPQTPISVGDGKIPRWVNIPELTNELKNWIDGRQILISFDGQIKICQIFWKEDQEMPTIVGGGVPPFHFAWPVAFVAVKYAFVRDYKRDAIMKENQEKQAVA